MTSLLATPAAPPAQQRPRLDAAAALREVMRIIPFPTYMNRSREASCRHVASTLRRLAPPPRRVLDFGSSPADITSMLSLMGYDCSAADDLRDPWHLAPGARQRILDFNQTTGVRFHILEDAKPWPWAKGEFDVVMLHHVMEHLHDSPKDLLNSLVGLLADNGLLYITVPNAANLRKRLAVLRGGTNHPPFAFFYWHQGPWRGHVREYVRSDLTALVRYLDLDLVELGTYHFRAYSSLPQRLHAPWRAATALFPDWRDSWYLLARKRPNWQPKTTLPDSDPDAATLRAIRH